MKKFFSIIMCISLLMCFAPSTALANEQEVATVDGTGYTTLDNAISAASGEDKIVVLTGNAQISNSTTVNNLVIKNGAKLSFGENGKLTVSKSLTVNGELDLNGVSKNDFANDTAADARTLTIKEGAEFKVYGTVKSKSNSNDICQLGTMTIYAGAKFYTDSSTLYIGSQNDSALTKIISGTLVSTPITNNSFSGGYNYTITGRAEAGTSDVSFPISFNDVFKVAGNAKLTATNISTSYSSKQDSCLEVESGGTLAVGNKGDIKLEASLKYLKEGAILELIDDVTVDKELVVSKNITINGNNHTISVSGNVSDKLKDANGQDGHLIELTSSSTIKNLILENGNKAKGVNTYGDAKAYNFNFENVKIKNSIGTGLTVKGGTATLKGVDISGSGWKQSIDISNSAGKENTGSVIIGGSIVLGDELQIVFDGISKETFSEGEKSINEDSVGMVNAPSYRLTSEDKEYTTTKQDTEYKYTKRIWTLSTRTGGGSSSSANSDNVINKSESGQADGGTSSAPSTTAAVKAETKTSADGSKTVSAEVKQTTADKIVQKAIENKSEEIIVTTTNAEIKETPAGTTTEVSIPASAVNEISEKTAASITIESEAAKVTLDQQAVAAVAEQAGTAGKVSLIVETVAQNESILQLELKIETSNGIVSDFRGGSVQVTVKLSPALAGKGIVCVYIDENGGYHMVSGARNPDGTYTFTTGHFSTYAIMAVEDADALISAQNDKIEKYVDELGLKARSKKTPRGNIKITVLVTSGDISAIEELGYTVKYKFYRSTKKASNYQAKLEKQGTTYTNTSGKRGTKYYYKARIMVYDSEGVLIAKSALKQCKYAVRTK